MCFEKHATRGAQRVAFDKNPFYNEVKAQPSIHRKVRYKHIMSDIGELPRLFDGSKIYDSKQVFELSLMNSPDKKIPLTLNTLWE